MKKERKKHRKIYVEKTGLPIPEKWHVHHLDHDSSNNDINNLVALPPNVHSKYHGLKNMIQKDFIDVSDKIPSYVNMVDVSMNDFYYEEFKEYWYRICYYTQFRDHLLYKAGRLTKYRPDFSYEYSYPNM